MSERSECFQGVVLGKYTVRYFLCEGCGLLQTEEPYWLEEAYDSAIADIDTGIVARNLDLAEKLSCLLYFQFDRGASYIDAAGGYGLLTRMMRDVGFDYYWSDQYCENLLARGFEPSSASLPPAAVTAFEALEHMIDPVGFVCEQIEKTSTRTMIFSTRLFRGEPPPIDEWWYYCRETGQHISFYQERTLRHLAERLSLKFYTRGDLHMLTAAVIRPLTYSFLTGPSSTILFPFVKARMVSKTRSDHDRLSLD